MRLSKMARQDRILDLILENIVSTQEDLVDLLRANKIEVTQATVSRDIKELSIVKVTLSDGQQKYVSMSRDKDLMNDRLIKIFTQAVQRLAPAANLVIVHTLPGMAPAAASAVDAMQVADIVGSLAGDDTIFIATPSDEQAANLCEQLRPLIHSRQNK
ncbi:arginine repressor [Oscillospiraceae bacterium HV4-5-C5C]|nr:arginine repressor [Oscillospiraceae bacterium HV4-5-C5C]